MKALAGRPTFPPRRAARAVFKRWSSLELLRLYMNYPKIFSEYYPQLFITILYYDVLRISYEFITIIFYGRTRLIIL